MLFHNQGGGTFKDVTRQAGLTLAAHSQTAAFFNYDNDGYLDLFVTNSAKWTLNQYDQAGHYFPGAPDFWQLSACPRENNILYHNNKDGTFTDVTSKAGLQGEGFGGDVAIFDFDEDGWIDLLVTNMFGASRLYRNRGNGVFKDVTKETLGRTSWGAIGSKAFDFNNDGQLHLLIVDMHSDMWLPPDKEPLKTRDNLRKKYDTAVGPLISRGEAPLWGRFMVAFKIRPEEVVFGNSLFKKLPSGKFAEVSDKANLETFWPWGIATGDFDKDGYEDVYLPSDMGFPYGYWPSALMMNNGDETFTDRAEAAGIEPPPGGRSYGEIGGRPAARSSRCAAVADFDGDGRRQHQGEQGRYGCQLERHRKVGRCPAARQEETGHPQPLKRRSHSQANSRAVQAPARLRHRPSTAPRSSTSSVCQPVAFRMPISRRRSASPSPDVTKHSDWVAYNDT